MPLFRRGQFTETESDLSTVKVVRAKKFQAAPSSLELGPSLSIGAEGGHVVTKDFAEGINDRHLYPSKGTGITTGTQGGFTTGLSVAAIIADEVLQGSSSLASDSPSAVTATNNESGKVKFIYTTTSHRRVSKFVFRFKNAASGVRITVRLNTSTGQKLFENVTPWEYELGIGGLTALAYTGTAATETVLNLTENAQVTEANTVYHVTIENVTNTVVMFGALVSSNYLPYLRHDVQNVNEDPVVAFGVESLTVSNIFDNNDWYEVKYCNASAGNISVTLPSAQEVTRQGLPIFITKTDSSANIVSIVPFGSQTINGATSVTLTLQHECAFILSDGTNFKLFRLKPDYTGRSEFALADASDAHTLHGTDGNMIMDINGSAIIFYSDTF